MIILAVAFIAGCTTPRQDPPKAFNTVAVISAKELTAIEAESRADRGKGAGVYGAKTGAATGAAVASVSSLYCGPWYAACWAVQTLGWTLTAWTIGEMAGALYGLSGFSETDAIYVNDALSRVGRDNDFQGTLVKRLKRQLPETMQATPALADVQVVVHLGRVEVVQKGDGDVRLETSGSMIMAWRAHVESEAIDRSEFNIESTAADLDHLLADDGAPLGAAIHECVARLADEIALAILAARGQPAEATP
jgi:hypothetical protein